MSGRRADAAGLVALLLGLLPFGISAQAEIAQKGNLRVSLAGKLSPKRLPRKEDAPISVSVGWKIATVDGSVPPTLKGVKIEINRNGTLNPTGLPTCAFAKIQPASTERALKNCRPALVGKGTFSALVSLQGQESYVTTGRMVVFNSEKAGKPVLYGQIYAPHPFPNSFVITFKVHRLAHGAYGTALTASLPPSLVAWGNLTEIHMRLSRRFAYRGKPHSFLSAACPTPKGIPAASFRLARASFSFVGASPIATSVSDDCRVRN